MKKGNLSVLIDIRYYSSMNRFEEVYGEGISYRRLEQDTYVELKSMINTSIGKKLHFKKCRDLEKNSNPMILTIMSEMSPEEYHHILMMKKKGEFAFMYDFIVSDIYLHEVE